MAVTCILLLPPSASLNAVSSRLRSAYPAATPSTTQPTFSLSHNLYRSTPTTKADAPDESRSSSAASSQQNPSAPSSLQSLHLSTRPSHSFLHTSKPNADDPSHLAKHTVVVPAGQGSASLATLITTKLNALWQPVRQYDLQISEAHGRAWDVGLFRVRVGELSAARSAAGPAGLRGVVVAVSSGLPVAQGADEAVRRLTRDFCEGLRLNDSQQMQAIEEYWGVTETELDEEGQWQQEVELWCRVLANKALTGIQGARRWDVMDVWTKTATSNPTAVAGAS